MDNVETDVVGFRDDCGRFCCDARFPEYESYPQRLESFDGTAWDVDTRCRLAEAGYFNPGRLATIQCFYCGLRIGQVTPRDNPWKIHEELGEANACEYFKHMKDTSGTPTCFDRRGEENGWVPCNQLNTCRLCVWEFLMITSE